MNAQDLKNSILQLAVQGKLVEQRAEEGTARELLEQIKLEKDQLIKDKKIKKSKPLPEITEEEIPFEIPESWEWVRLVDIVEFRMGKTPPRGEERYWKGNYRWVSISDMIDGSTIYNTKETVSEIAIQERFKFVVPKETMLMSFKLTVGKVSILGIDAVHNEAIISIYPYHDRDYIMRNYLFKVLPYMSVFGKTKKAIMGFTLNSDSLSRLLIPIPPLEEQHRIVAKIEEILPYIEQYDKAYTKLETFNKKFPEDMKKSILQMAMQGKLVEQLPEEGTADELYEQIVAEKSQLIKDGKIKKEKSLPDITEDEIPFEIPSSWKWVRLADIVTLQNGDRSNKYPVESDYVEDGIPFFGAKDMGIKYMSFDSVRFISQNKFDELRTGKLCDKDFICLLRGSVGKVAIFSENEHHKTGFICAQMIILRSLIREVVDYLYSVFSSPYYYRCIELKTTGTAVRQLPAKELGNILIPLPPLAEQKRIVAKIEELLPYCDQLIK
ncbi:MAG: restriction endonuclease subunit S [Lachnoclostridium sp.]|nr:restriction endonuclease subunit S [Lachnoclostridium sp.]